MYGLIGKGLSHSFSKEIHESLGNLNYNIYNLTDLDSFIRNNELLGFNITMPYKTEIIKCIQQMDSISKETNSINTVVNRNGIYYGYNTDYYGFVELIKFYNIKIENKRVLVLGNGSVAKTVIYALKRMNARKIKVLARRIIDKDEDLLENYDKYLDFDCLINTTPVGMYPNNEEYLPLDLTLFENLKIVIDLIYNPINTNLLLEAKKQGIKAYNGFFMLIMQAKRAHEIFFDVDIPNNLAIKIYYRLLKKMYNLVFIGLPLSGKSKYSNLISDKLNKSLFDMDNEIEKKHKMSIPDFFKKYSEEVFRKEETTLIKNIYKKQNLTISTGGGVIENSKNIELLKQNGVIIFLNKDPNQIAKKEIFGRPLIKSAHDVLNLAKKRIPLYINACDILIDIDKDTVYHMYEIEEKFNEYINY